MRTKSKTKIASILCVSAMAISVCAFTADKTAIEKKEIASEKTSTETVKKSVYSSSASFNSESIKFSVPLKSAASKVTPVEMSRYKEAVNDAIDDAIANNTAVFSQQTEEIKKQKEEEEKKKKAAAAKKKAEEEKKAQEAAAAQTTAEPVEIIVIEETVEEPVVEEEPEETKAATTTTKKTEAAPAETKKAATTTTTKASSTSDDGLYINPIIDSNWNSNGHLTSWSGVYYGPSGKETYYNLNMSGVVKIMRNKGFSEDKYPYWVRDDGCKMLGNYIMVACDLNKRARGTLVHTSLGLGIVCDTGGFAASNSNQIDIATNW